VTQLICRKLKVVEQMAGGSGLSEIYDHVTVRGVSIDSRTVKEGNLFVPIVRQQDGHNYVREAMSRGAAAALWQRDRPNAPTGVPIIYVDDSLQVLQQLAASYRRELPVRVVGVTGSNGKTTTKDMINSVAAAAYRVHKTEGNLNSQIGVPLTVLAIDGDTEVAVIEMGMSEPGQIGRLSRIVRPDIAVITMIGVSHLSTLGSRERIAEAKLEIVAGMPDDGVLICNGDEPLLRGRDLRTGGGKPVKTVRFGEGSDNEYRAGNIAATSDGVAFTVGKQLYRILLLGAHNVCNALAAIAVAERLGIAAAAIAEAFLSMQMTGMRMERTVSPSGCIVINDAWNASPISMAAAITAFEELEGCARKIVVLGDMLELGEHEQEYHREIGKSLQPDRIDYVYTVGALGQYIAAEAEQRFPDGRVRVFTNKQELLDDLKTILREHDAVLLKASRGMQLETIVPFL